jgi:ankyrin repeat protein
MLKLILIGLISATPLVEAVKQGDVQAVRALIKAGADVRVPEGDGATALHWAAYRDSSDLVRVLLDAGASAAVANDLGVTPLHLAAANGSAATMRLLLDKRADVNAATAAGVTPLMEAARGGSVDAVGLLVAGGANVNAREHARGQTALMWAVSRQHPEIVKVLLENHADVHARTGTRPVMAMLDQGPRAVKTSARDARQIEMGGSTASNRRGCCSPPAPTRTMRPVTASRHWSWRRLPGTAGSRACCSMAARIPMSPVPATPRSMPRRCAATCC